MVPVTVNNTGPHPFVFDLGSSDVLLTKKFSASHNVRTFKYKKGTGGSGVVKVGMGKIKSISVCGMLRANFEVGITDEVKRIFTSADLSEVVGILGYSFFKGKTVTISYPTKRFDICDPPGDFGAMPPAIPFTLAAPAQAIVLVDVFLNSVGPFSFSVDTGATVTNISRSVAQQFNLKESSIHQIDMGGGHVSGSLVRMKEVKLGDKKVPNLNVFAVDYLNRLSEVLGKNIDGILGYDFLKHFEIVIDYSSHILLLK